MGNCIRNDRSSTQWGGEDWGSFTSNHKSRNNQSSYRENSVDSLAEEKGIVFEERVLTTGTELKIKISKKQLEQLLNKADVQGMTAERALEQLMNRGDFSETHHQPPWKPALRTVPE